MVFIPFHIILLLQTLLLRVINSLILTNVYTLLPFHESKQATGMIFAKDQTCGLFGFMKRQENIDLGQNVYTLLPLKGKFTPKPKFDML